MVRLRTDWISENDMALVLRLLSPANALVAQVALHTGLRVSDVLGLRSEQIAKNRVTVRELKTKKSRRIYIPEKLRQALEKQSGTVYVFEHAKDPERHRTRQAVWKDIKRAAWALRIDQNVAPHSCRKIYAVEYYKLHGLEATRRKLGHESQAVTLIYLLSELTK
jgi:integrase